MHSSIVTYVDVCVNDAALLQEQRRWQPRRALAAEGRKLVVTSHEKSLALRARNFSVYISFRLTTMIWLSLCTVFCCGHVAGVWVFSTGNGLVLCGIIM